MDTSTKGMITEARVVAALLSKGFCVAKPLVDCRFDLLLVEDGTHKTVQCKTGRLQDGSVNFNAYSNTPRMGTQDYSDIDYFGVYCFETDAVYLVPTQDVGTAKPHLRVDPVKNGQKDRVRFAKAYKL